MVLESDAGGRLLTRVDPTPCLSHATQLRTSSQELHRQRYISKARHPNSCGPTWAACVSACLARRQSGWMVGFEMCELHAGDWRGPFFLSAGLRWRGRMQVSGKTSRSSHVHPPVNDPSFRHQCVWNHNSASECADCLPRAGDLREIQVWGRICIKHRRR